MKELAALHSKIVDSFYDDDDYGDVIDAALEEAYRLSDQAWLARVQAWIGEFNSIASALVREDGQFHRGKAMGYHWAADYLKEQLAAIEEKEKPPAAERG